MTSHFHIMEARALARSGDGGSFNKAGTGGRAGWVSSAAPRSNPGPDFAARADELPAVAARLRTA